MSNQALGNIKQAIFLYGKAAKYEPANLIHYYHLTDLNKEMLDEELKNKIQKVMDTKNCTKQSLAYGNFLLSRYEAKNKNYDLEFNFLKKGHQFFFDSKQKEFKDKMNYWLNGISNIKKIKIEQEKILR